MDLHYVAFSESGLEGGFEKTENEITNGALIVLYHKNLDLIISKLSNFADTIPMGNRKDKEDRFIDVDVDFVVDNFSEIQELSPYGNGFESPVFRSTGKIESIKVVGGAHVKGVFNGIDMIYFNAKTNCSPLLGQTVNLKYTASMNCFAGKSNLQLIVKEIE